MRRLTVDEINRLAKGKNVRKVAIENFLAFMGDDASKAYANLELDKRLYKWKAPTVNAILRGIELAQKKPAKKQPKKGSTKKKLIFVSTWEGSANPKGCLMNEETGKMQIYQGKVVAFFADREALKKSGIPIYRGKKKKEFLRKFNLVVDPKTKIVRRRKR